MQYSVDLWHIPLSGNRHWNIRKHIEGTMLLFQFFKSFSKMCFVGWPLLYMTILLYDSCTLVKTGRKHYLFEYLLENKIIIVQILAENVR